ncbi:hypothetical protein TSUD_406570, partial [Trifolium subterraneum]
GKPRAAVSVTVFTGSKAYAWRESVDSGEWIESFIDEQQWHQNHMRDRFLMGRFQSRYNSLHDGEYHRARNNNQQQRWQSNESRRRQQIPPRRQYHDGWNQNVLEEPRDQDLTVLMVDMEKKEILSICQKSVIGFEVCGMLEDVYVPNRRNKRGEPYGFAKFSNVRDVLKLTRAVNNVWFGHYRVRARFANFVRNDMAA